MKKILMTSIILLCCGFVFANPVAKCVKKYSVDAQKAYILSYSALKNCKYKVLEVQSESGYILFKSGSREFLLEASPKGSDTLIKIMPVDSDLSDLSVQENVFKSFDSEMLKAK